MPQRNRSWDLAAWGGPGVWLDVLLPGMCNFGVFGKRKGRGEQRLGLPRGARH